MNRIFFCFLFFFISIAAHTQSWQPLGIGVNNTVRALFADTLENTIYTGEQAATLHKWNGAYWDSIDFFEGSFIEGIAKWNNKLYVGGNFNADTGVCGGLAYFDGNYWTIEPMKQGIANFPSNCGFIINVYVYDSNLYVMGVFDTIGGVKANSIARWDGNNWFAYSNPVGISITNISDAIFYKGELYIGGNFDYTPGMPNMNDIARFDGTQWKPVGNGLSGGDAWVNRFYIYRDTLIVAGYFQKANGDPGNNIVGWDGNNWIELGDGVLPSNVLDVIEYDKYLYACGQISYLSNGTPINRMAKWKSGQQQWIDAGLDFRQSDGITKGTPTSFALLNNDIYIGGTFFSVNGDTVNNIVKYSSSTGIEEKVNLFEIKITPNPFGNSFTIMLIDEKVDERQTSVDITIYNHYGQPILQQITITKKSTINLSSCPSGIYFLKVVGNGQTQAFKIIKL